MPDTSPAQLIETGSKQPSSALVMGGAGSLAEDIEKARPFGPYDAIFAVNDALSFYDGIIDYAVTLHPENLKHWLDTRRANGWPLPHHVVAERQKDGLVDDVRHYKWRGQSTSGSSGFFAVKTAIEEGFERIVLAGVPMDAERGHVNDGKPWNEVKIFWPAWEEMLPRIGPYTRSVSGRTADLLGFPTQEWRYGVSETVPVARNERK